ncbi:hypothetical protein VE01_01702 [Pseudogymnoascus verrucosus]|uniref:Uncharacterized protein n=1 Tax=Pseudogymnoascus verrucosus TaxID=342668 RepID=A0A1B8GWG5_9PEZI|nr:uncharacterized protein VE01_01702 [Pseudogymnoascus verrucosus]OBU00159.1 hypothetical protein VE01_01702 [Pseudogymnoascus verrucosus]
MSTPNTSHGNSQPETSAGAASTEGVLVIEDKIKISHEAIIDFSSPIITDEDVVCSQTDRDGFKAFVEDQGESDLGKTIRLIDYIVAKEIYESSQADLVNEPRFHGVTIQETATLVVMRIRNETFTKLKTSEAAWELFLMALRQDGVACDYKNETEALIRTLGGTVPMDVWDRIWRQFMPAWRADVFRASSAMANDLVNFIDS